MKGSFTATMSTSLCSIALRKTIRPMRPNPLIPTCADVLVTASWRSGVVEGAYLDNHDELSVVLRKLES